MYLGVEFGLDIFFAMWVKLRALKLQFPFGRNVFLLDRCCYGGGQMLLLVVISSVFLSFLLSSFYFFCVFFRFWVSAALVEILLLVCFSNKDLPLWCINVTNIDL